MALYYPGGEPRARERLQELRAAYTSGAVESGRIAPDRATEIQREILYIETFLEEARSPGYIYPRRRRGGVRTSYKPSPWIQQEYSTESPYLPNQPWPWSFPYSEEAWSEHKGRVDVLMDDIRAGRAKLTGAFLSNPHYGGYSYEREQEKVSVDYADPHEVLMIVTVAGQTEVNLAGPWWKEHGYEGWGETVPAREAWSLLELARKAR